MQGILCFPCKIPMHGGAFMALCLSFAASLLLHCVMFVLLSVKLPTVAAQHSQISE